METCKHFRITKLKKELIENIEYKCAANLLCDRCRSKSVPIKFKMAPPGYVPLGNFGYYYGDNIDCCIWYGAEIKNKKWFRNSDFINLCPDCYKKVFVSGYKGYINTKEMELIKAGKTKEARPVPKSRHKDTKVARKTAANTARDARNAGH
jgi:hypothetical protein